MTTPLDPSVAAFLHALKARGVRPGLAAMRALAEGLGNPQDRYPVIHIAGTNGKGSVAAMLETIFRTAGWRTGLYTSPHLVRLGERIQVDREPLSNEDLAAYIDELRPRIERGVGIEGPGEQPSYFEFMTAVAFLHFARTRCDIAIVEVGLGGRLDATNIVTPEVSVITSIGFDHMEFLGNSLAEIAAQKAGIIKRGRPVVIGWVPPDAERVIRVAADAQASAVISVREEFGDAIVNYPPTNLPGEYQRINAATANLVARQFDARWRVGDAHVRSALEQVEWPARWQQLEVGGRRVIIDATHNEEGAYGLDRNLSELCAVTREKPVVVLGVLGRVRAKPILAAACRHAAELRLVQPRQGRACSFEELESLLPRGFIGKVTRTTVADVFPAAGVCCPDIPPHVPVVVTGSIYLAGEALAAIDPSRGPLENDLQDF